MQTFRSQSAQSNNSSDEVGDGVGGVKKAKYVPYIPGETNLESEKPVENTDLQNAPAFESQRQNPPAAPAETMTQAIPQSNPDQVFKDQVFTPETAGTIAYTVPPQQQAPVYYAEPQYVQYAPVEPSFGTGRPAMDKDTFRKMIIGLFGGLFALFIILIIAFSGKNVQHKLPPDLLVFQPQAQQKILPPLTITGQARGYWFYNNEFPVIVYDSTDTAIAYGVAKTTADTNTKEFLPFTAVIEEYTFLPAKKRGYILFQRSTGDIQQGRQNTARVPIQFAEGTGIIPIVQTDTDPNSPDTPTTDPNNPNPPLVVVKQCGDGIDNDNDGSIDMQDAECHTDGNASNSVSYEKTRREDKITINLPDITVGQFVGDHNGFVTLYFPNTADDPINPSCSKVFPINRTLSPGPLGSTVEKTLRALMLGPTAEEGYGGFVSGMKKGMALDRIELVGDTLAIYVTSSTIVGDPSWCTLADIKKQIYQTMVQFAGVNNIRIYANGQIL